jgi:hypothetical protein
MRAISVKVLPVPGPALTNSRASKGNPTIARCSSVNLIPDNGKDKDICFSVRVLKMS